MTGSTYPKLHQYMDNGRYCLLHVHAICGTTHIYRALDTHLGREVTLKILAPELSNDALHRERFFQEARRVAALHHPLIVPLLNYGEEGDLYYLVMPYYSRSLRDLFQKRRAFPLADVVALVTGVAAALDYAHQFEIVHQNVKPENMFLDESGHGLLGDFGIAPSEVAAPPDRSLEYTSPEKLVGRPLDRRADVYGLGVVVYEMLTGLLPFPLGEDGTSALTTRIRTEQATPPSLLTPVLLPLSTDAVVLKALERDRHRRYSSAGEFSSDLAETLAVPIGTIPYEYPTRPPFRSIPLHGPSITTPLRPRRLISASSSSSWIGALRRFLRLRKDR